MLSSIHPFGERSRNNSFRRTASAHIAGGALGGLTLGAVVGSLGWLVTTLLSPSNQVRTIIVMGAALIALALEATNRERSLPTRTRQVNENWIQSYRGWVYGSGFGAELGFGISTIITTSLVHLLVIAMLLVGSLPESLLLGAAFGTARSATVLAARKIDSPERLRLFHQQLHSLRSRSRSAAVAALALASAVGLAGLVFQ
ncbi:MAG: hypothetical protein ACI81L_000362 [Verrucomicrobiales bacterium]|jgi:hypothetical protein